MSPKDALLNSELADQRLRSLGLRLALHDSKV